ncbi:hypothetical protein G7Y89_g8950 [Cudoniella acicularis]|uniref:Saponin hydrolase n=1 Tax=Cudoniella acicularis TaxID=354080 RepID=A0A8H4W0L2_9HELO|nr:hypothetical protein G7Y89_g8950 [Cudoniella acicularis]
MRLKANTRAPFLGATALTLATSALSTNPGANLQAIITLPDLPTPPQPEPIEVTELPLPPVTLDEREGSCTAEINSRGTGCIGQRPNLQSGSFLPDDKHVLASLNFTGASVSSIYYGPQLIIVKTDGTTFSNGDPWKCLTCGVPEGQQLGRSPTMDYPQAFSDGKRALFGTNILDCGPWQLASEDCTAERTHIYPIRWNVQADGSGEGGNIRELRRHPDDVHLGFNAMVISGGTIGQFGYFARLQFNPVPASGIPLTPRYDLVNVTTLFNPGSLSPVSVKGSNIFVNPQAITVGELRGFSGRGNEVTYLGYPAESCNIDVFGVDLTTGAVRRLTSNPEYVDPVDISPDDQWSVVMDTRGSGRQLFLAAMRGVPPIVDLVITAITASVRNNGQRRFFQPWLLDRHGDRGSYSGQKINAAGGGSLGSVNDPQWNGMADPKWSHDGTAIVYWQQMTHFPACGGANPLPCPKSTEPGGRIDRIMIARLTSRTTVPQKPVAPISDTVPWGLPYIPGSELPSPKPLPPGSYTLIGKVSGFATVSLIAGAGSTFISTVAVTYQDFSDDGENTINGSEEVTVSYKSPTLNHADWFSNLTSTGANFSTKITSPGGFHVDINIAKNIFTANGTLTTTVDGVAYLQPDNYT